AREICPFFLKKRCAYGEKCLFAHVRPATFSNTAASKPLTIPCKFFAHGYCRLGTKCRFAHEVPDARPDFVYRRPSGESDRRMRLSNRSQPSTIESSNEQKSPAGCLWSENSNAQVLLTDSVRARPTFSFVKSEQSLKQEQVMDTSHPLNDMIAASQLGFSDADVYTPLNGPLSRQELKIYQSKDPFRPGFVPLLPPPKEMCFT
ncbi:hypothetical protein CRM22_002157, partial [Opisthorchis felineus]